MIDFEGIFMVNKMIITVLVQAYSSFTITVHIEACRESHYSGLCMAYAGLRVKQIFKI